MNAFVIHTLPWLLLGLLFKSACLLLGAWAACGLLRRASAATRHLVWSAALGGVLLLPLLMLSLPHWDMALRHAPTALTPPILPPPAAAPAEAAPVPSSALSPNAPALPLPPPTVPTPRPPRPIQAVIAWPAVWAVTGLGVWLLGVWLLGVITTLTRLAVGLRRVGTIGRQALPLNDTALALAESLHDRLGVRRSVTFLRAAPGSGVSVPLTWGGRRPTVLLPAQSEAWPEDSLRAALLHELAHVARWDWTTQTLSRLACALYWVNPLVWRAARAARAESERACDDCVLGAGIAAADYAQRLVDVVRSLPDGPLTGTVAIAMARPSEVESRLRALLAKGRNRGPLTRRRALGTLAVLTLLALPLAALRLVAQAQNKFTAADSTQTAPDGSTVRLVGISEHPSEPGTWWGQDGVRLPKPPADWRVLSHSPMTLPEGQKARKFVFNITGTQFDDHLRLDLMDVLLDPHSKNILDIASHRTPGHGGLRLSLVEALPAAQKTETVRVGVASGPWRTLGTAALINQNEETSMIGSSTELGNYTVRLSPPSIVGGVLTFTWTYTGNPKPTRFHTFRFAAIDTQGKHMPASPRLGKRVAGVWQHIIVFPTLAITDIQELEVQVRSYDWTEFKNVPLQPVGADASFGLPRPEPVSVGFRRYVSRPTPEGTRYTFLYPAYMTKISANRPDTKDITYESVSLYSSPAPVSWTPVRGGVPVTYPAPAKDSRSPPVPLNEGISVEVGQKYPPPFLRPTPPRRDRQWAGPDGSHHDIALTDPRTQRRFWLNHDAYFAPALFRQTDPVIADSFRILLPTTPVSAGTHLSSHHE